MRGATGLNRRTATSIDISIHAPHARSDARARALIRFFLVFQSTLLMRGATSHSGRRRQRRTIISIHALHARSDAKSSRERTYTHNFNPRSSCEERRLHRLEPSGCFAFQSTLLMRGATLQPRTFEQAAYSISIHAPHARSDSCAAWGAQLRQCISIHAPHARSDYACLLY